VRFLSSEKKQSATKALVDYVQKTRFADFPEEVVEKAKICIMDAIGCGLGGYRTRIGEIVLGLMRNIGGRSESTLFGDGSKIPCTNAAFVNSTLTNALDMDDTGVGHPGSTIIPAALAVGESIGCSGKDLLNAIICGYEVSERITAAIQPSPERFLNVWFIGTPQIFGSVTAAAKLLGLDAFQTASAFGVAGTFAPVPSERDAWSWESRPLHWVKDCVAFPAYGGILSALLSKSGFIGSRNILDGKKSFYIMAGSDRCNYERMTAGLGKTYEIMNVSFKPYACCRRTHSSLDAIVSLVNANKLKPKDIDSVEIKMFAPIVNEFTDYSPANMIDAEFSLPYVTALVLMGEKSGPNWFTEDKMKNEEILTLANRVKIDDQDEEAKKALLHEGKQIAKVTIHARDGRKYHKRLDYTRGSPQNPLKKEELDEKFEHLASFAISHRKTEKLRESIGKLDAIENVKEFSEMLY
jgi:2-methylcitrate dehydratase PrpD